MTFHVQFSVQYDTAVTVTDGDCSLSRMTAQFSVNRIETWILSVLKCSQRGRGSPLTPGCDVWYAVMQLNCHVTMNIEDRSFGRELECSCMSSAQATDANWPADQEEDWNCYIKFNLLSYYAIWLWYCRSTETIVLAVYNDLVCSIGAGQIASLAFLDLSSKTKIKYVICWCLSIIYHVGGDSDSAQWAISVHDAFTVAIMTTALAAEFEAWN